MEETIFTCCTNCKRAVGCVLRGRKYSFSYQRHRTRVQSPSLIQAYYSFQERYRIFFLAEDYCVKMKLKNEIFQKSSWVWECRAKNTGSDSRRRTKGVHPCTSWSALEGFQVVNRLWEMVNNTISHSRLHLDIFRTKFPWKQIDAAHAWSVNE